MLRAWPGKRPARAGGPVPQGKSAVNDQAPTVVSVDDPTLDELCAKLAEYAADADSAPRWPQRQMDLCARYGVYRWFLPREYGGLGWSEPELLQGYYRLGAACQTTTFILTQLTGAARRIAASENEALKRELLPPLARGEQLATLGISHLTTSRRHWKRPPLLATETPAGFLLEGTSPWVTGAVASQYVVLGAETEDRRQLMLVLPLELPGVEVKPPLELVALSGSCTGAVECHRVEVSQRWLLAGPEPELMRKGGGGATGGLQTSTLALALARAAVDYLLEQARLRPDLAPVASRFQEELELRHAELMELAAGGSPCTKEQLRQGANSLVLRATQAALAAAKGTGFVRGHPAGRWAAEALFYLVWSCPQAVMQANLCQLAGLEQ